MNLSRFLVKEIVTVELRKEQLWIRRICTMYTSPDGVCVRTYGVEIVSPEGVAEFSDVATELDTLLMSPKTKRFLFEETNNSHIAATAFFFATRLGSALMFSIGI